MAASGVSVVTQRGTRQTTRVNAANTPAKKRHILALVAEGRTDSDACKIAEVSLRTLVNWKQRDEKFALEFERAARVSTDKLVGEVRDSLHDPDVPHREKTLRYFFLIKQRDPSFRDNHKVEHSVSSGLQAALKQLAKMGE